MSSRTVSPSATMPTTVATGIRKPRMLGARDGLNPKSAKRFGES
jgi:hypothetical protein